LLSGWRRQTTKGLKARVQTKLMMTQKSEKKTVVADQPTSQHFGRECNHGDVHAQSTNAGFSRKPNGGGFYSY
jgi:hypothetical protein